jgi:hypothetical protein
MGGGDCGNPTRVSIPGFGVAIGFSAGNAAPDFDFLSLLRSAFPGPREGALLYMAHHGRCVPYLYSVGAIVGGVLGGHYSFHFKFPFLVAQSPQNCHIVIVPAQGPTTERFTWSSIILSKDLAVDKDKDLTTD